MERDQFSLAQMCLRQTKKQASLLFLVLISLNLLEYSLRTRQPRRQTLVLVRSICLWWVCRKGRNVEDLLGDTDPGRLKRSGGSTAVCAL